MNAFIEQLITELQTLVFHLANSTTIIFWALVLLVVLVIVLDAFSAIAAKKRQSAGVNPEVHSVLTPSSIFKEAKEYSSDQQLLSAKPDALLVEHGYIIPVERKPFANKIRDRYVVELLICMRLIEEFEGKRPPYGYLILGKQARRVKIMNTKSRQDSLDLKIMQMRSILDREVPVVALPEPRKCLKCLVKDFCDSKIINQNR